MAHFARVVNKTVVKVHVVANDVITNAQGVESEKLGQKFLSKLYGYKEAELVQCSYNGTIRGVYPGVGYLYNSSKKLFFAPSIPTETTE